MPTRAEKHLDPLIVLVEAAGLLLEGLGASSAWSKASMPAGCLGAGRAAKRVLQLRQTELGGALVDQIEEAQEHAEACGRQVRRSVAARWANMCDQRLIQGQFGHRVQPGNRRAAC